VTQSKEILFRIEPFLLKKDCLPTLSLELSINFAFFGRRSLIYGESLSAFAMLVSDLLNS
jgi:hypothetical protein